MKYLCFILLDGLLGFTFREILMGSLGLLIGILVSLVFSFMKKPNKENTDNQDDYQNRENLYRKLESAYNNLKIKKTDLEEEIDSLNRQLNAKQSNEGKLNRNINNEHRLEPINYFPINNSTKEQEQLMFKTFNINNEKKSGRENPFENIERSSVNIPMPAQEIMKYAEMPHSEGYFSIQKLKTESTANSLYILRLNNENSTKGSLEINVKNEIIHRLAINNSNNFLKPVCNYNTNNIKGAGKIIQITSGTVAKEGDKWRVIKKINIIFG